MYQVAAPIWNAIAKEQKLQTTFAKRLFPLEEERLDEALTVETLKLMKAGVDDSLVRIAYLTVAPLLWENQAIQAFAARHPQYQPALKDVADLSEAVLMASRDFPLNTSQQARLRNLLETAPA